MDEVRQLEGRPDAFGQATTFQLLPGDTLPLGDSGPGAPISPADPPPCEAVLVVADGLPSTVLLWSGIARRKVGGSTTGTIPVPEDGRVDLVIDDAGRLATTRTAELDSFPFLERVEPSGCVGGLPASFSEVMPNVGARLISAISIESDGCLGIDLEQGAAEEATFALCVPAEDFPFAPGDVVTITEDAMGLRIEGPGAEVLVGSLSQVDVDAAVLPQESCVGTRGSGYAIEALVLVRDNEVMPGQRVEISADALGRGRTLWVSSAWTAVVGFSPGQGWASVVVVAREGG